MANHGAAQIANVPSREELDITCAGINHQTWYIGKTQRGRVKRQVIGRFLNHKEYSQTEKVRIDILKRFGYYSTESMDIFPSIAWYRKRPDEINDWKDPRYGLTVNRWLS